MRRVKIGVIGLGRMGRLYARIIAELPHAELSAVCSQREATVQAVASEWGVPGYAGGASRQMLAAHPEIEAVVVATPEWLHVDPALAVIEAGRHLLLEKPMATSVSEARRILHAAEAAGVTLMLCHMLRFDPRFALMKEAVDRGDIGELRHIYARRHHTTTGVARVRGRIPLTHWISAHDFDMMRWVTGSRVLSVSAYSRPGAREAEDYLQARLRFASGVTGIFEQSWAAPPLAGWPRQAQFDVRGTGGTIEVTPQAQGLGILTPASAVYPPVLDYPIVHGRVFGIFPAMVAHFAECVATGRRPLVDGHDGVATIAIADALQRSIAEGREVEVPGDER